MNSTYAFAVMDSEGVFRRNLSEVVTGLADKKTDLPISLNLGQNYPNPFNPSTTINYQIPKDGFVSLKVFDIVGNEVKTLVNEYRSAGNYSVNFDASNLSAGRQGLSSGIYFYQIKTNNYFAVKKMLLLK